MERLTQRLRTGEVLMASEYEEKYTEQEWISVLQDRLAAYEETMQTPEEIDMDHEAAEQFRHLCQGCDLGRLEELAEADKAGRLVVLPCKVGDTVWIVGAVRKLYSAKVRTFFCGHTSAVRGDDNDGHIHMIRTTECDIQMQEFGKTVFLSREEAEKALQEMEGRS